MTYDEILKACIERAPDDQVLQDAFDDLIYQHVGTDKRASAINNAGAKTQVKRLKLAGYTTERILIEIAEQLAISVNALGERVSSPAVPVLPKVLKRVRFTYEVLCPVDDTDVEKMGLADIQMACEQGDCSGHFIDTEVKLLNRRQAKLACEEHGSSPDFFLIPEFEIGTRVFWNHGACSAYARVTAYDHPIYSLVNDAGGEIKCEGHELFLKKPKKGKKS